MLNYYNHYYESMMNHHHQHSRQFPMQSNVFSIILLIARALREFIIPLKKVPPPPVSLSLPLPLPLVLAQLSFPFYLCLYAFRPADIRGAQLRWDGPDCGRLLLLHLPRRHRKSGGQARSSLPWRLC